MLQPWACPDLDAAAAEAHRLTTHSSWSEKARYLQQLFGQRLAAAVVGVEDAKTVGRWINGQEPRLPQQQRLRAAYQIARLLELADSREAAQAWFFGMNPALDDQPPARVIAEGEAAGGARAMKAARSFLVSG